jgi:uncharacterized Tic20 family protein
MSNLPPDSFDPVHPGSGDAEIPRNERTMVMLCHLLGLSGYIVPFGHLIGPLVVWLVKKDESVAVDIAGRESVNFAITITIVGIVGFVLVFFGIGICILLVLPVLHAVPIIIAAIKASDGRQWRYPVNIRLV